LDKATLIATIVGSAAGVIAVGVAIWFGVRTVTGKSNKTDIRGSIGGPVATGANTNVADRGSTIVHGNLVQSSVDTEARAEIARVKEQLAELQKGVVAGPPGAVPVDTTQLAEQATARTQRLLEEAIELQRQHRERDAIERLLTAYDMELPPEAKVQLHILAGNGFFRLSEYEEAEGHYRQALDASRAAQDRQGEANALGNLGLIYTNRDALDRAEQYHKEALAIDREIGNRLSEANQLGNLGNIYHHRGDLDHAEQYHQDALAIDREIGYRLGEAQDLGNLGILAARRDQRDEACQLLTEAAAIYKGIGAGGQGPGIVRAKLKELGCQ
jgi:tetratricopeptide (TPR) repeat protein